MSGVPKDKRLADNRKAAKASRLRKKARSEELQRSIVFLTKENATLNERCSILEAALFASVPPETRGVVEHLKAENQALKIALYESVATLARAAAATGGESLAAALPPFVVDSLAATTTAPASAAAAGTGAVGGSKRRRTGAEEEEEEEEGGGGGGREASTATVALPDQVQGQP